MLLKRPILERIAVGEISLVFRRWRRPTVKVGGTLRTAVGVLAIEAVDAIGENDLRSADARKAGFASLEDLLDDLKSQRAGQLYRIKLHRAGDDPRIALRNQSQMAKEEFALLVQRLDKFDAGEQGPWTRQVLQTIANMPETPAGELAIATGLEKEWLKTNIRKLKNLGLTESLQPGYRLSPRGKTLLKRLVKS